MASRPFDDGPTENVTGRYTSSDQHIDRPCILPDHGCLTIPSPKEPSCPSFTIETQSLPDLPYGMHDFPETANALFQPSEAMATKVPIIDHATTTLRPENRASGRVRQATNTKAPWTVSDSLGMELESTFFPVRSEASEK